MISKKLLISVLFISMIPVTLISRAASLPEITRPDVLKVGGRGVYILCGSTVFRYSMPHIRFVGAFGKEGEGPGEIKQSPFYSNSLLLLDDNIVIDSVDKVLYFNHRGELKKEMKKKGGLMTQMVPVGDNFIAKSLDRSSGNKEYLVLSVLDSQMKKIKEIYRQISPVQPSSIVMIPDSLYFCVSGNEIFVEKSDQGFFIDVFDQNGRTIRQIKKDILPVPVTVEDRQEVLSLYKADPVVKQIGYENLKRRNKYIYPEHFPAIQAIKGDGRRLYVKTFRKKENREEYLVMDREGRGLHAVYLPPQEKGALLARLNGLDQQLYTFHEGIFYWVHFDGDLDEWQLSWQKVGSQEKHRAP